MALAHPANASTVQLGLDLPRHFAAKWTYKDMHLKERASDSLIDQSPETPVVMADLQRAIDKRRVDNIKLSLAYADFAFSFKQTIRPLRLPSDLQLPLQNFYKVLEDVFFTIHSSSELTRVMRNFHEIVTYLPKLTPNEITRVKLLAEQVIMIVIGYIDREDLLTDLDWEQNKLKHNPAGNHPAILKQIERLKYQLTSVDRRLSHLHKEALLISGAIRLH
jgi:hypothetical protein